jgi:hypothetical protein
MAILTDTGLDECTRSMAELEKALLRRGVHERATNRESCSGCRRTPLVGERVYQSDGGALLCELCRPGATEPATRSSVVHGPAFGHSIRILESRAA